MTDPAPSPLSPKDEARVSFALSALKLGNLAYALLPLDPDAPRGERLHRTLALKAALDNLIARAAVAEREEGTTWEELGTAAGITKQSAHGRWTPHMADWAATGRTALRTSKTGHTALHAAAALDVAYARQEPDRPTVFSSGLDAVRYPGAEAAERARAERAAATHARLAELADETRLLGTRFRALTADGGAPAARAALLGTRATAQEEAARRLEELCDLEPESADAYRARADEARATAAADREFAGLLAPQEPGAAL